jgi:hypothetical protein
MRVNFYLSVFLVSFVCHSYGQTNPVQNLTFSQSYENMHNLFQLTWEEPAQPHDELIGYNIYRNDELYRFQTDTTLYYVYAAIFGAYVTNDGGGFLIYYNSGQLNSVEFDIHVTAVYNPGPVESSYLQTEHCYGAALSTAAFKPEQTVLYPNPTHGVLHIGNPGVQKIMLYDVSGKAVGSYGAATEIDLSGYAKGLYIIKLFTKNSILADKLLIE